ncbi:peptide chain release factor N(5)-glutamine methyltransferase [Aggregatibacter actinomycetemcomitans]|uniref:HemK/PrmC family methyltransferase n=1 Tax=Aggregatibacter actinomycetemcomitans TaxID=714 RepID=UPI00197C566F|nr:HemK/PrmC family methyltransferase [Aggregatibacter actinomycetemcomitans]MBN6070978.1 peptide chain release factor N(5)-glutamine methyltransferase [Aggregatibacter actinomycetemcomitans]
MNYQQWLQQATQALNQANPSENGKTDAQVLLQFVTQKSRATILAFGETVLDEKTLEKLTALLARRLQGEPIAYILGEKEFWSLPLNVSAGTLIPRPDTEILVEKAVAIATDKINGLLRNRDFPSPACGGRCPKDGRGEYRNASPQPLAAPPVNGGSEEKFRILDLGTGTGAIALALASALKPIAQKHAVPLDIIGVDLTPEVVALAKSNGAKNQLEVAFMQSRWFENVTGKFDLIVSNPPYIDAHDEHLAQGDVRFEPLSALVAAEEGYADLHHIIANAPKFMRENGYLLVEHGWQQGEKVRSIFQENFWSAVETLRDYGNNERVTLGCWAQTENK